MFSSLKLGLFGCLWVGLVFDLFGLCLIYSVFV